jgi:hypothetical protein
MRTYGTHRVKNPGLEDGVWITDGKGGFEIPESTYRDKGYHPPLQRLPWGSPEGPEDGQGAWGREAPL